MATFNDLNAEQDEERFLSLPMFPGDQVALPGKALSLGKGT